MARLNPTDVQALIYDPIQLARDREQLIHDLPVRAAALDGKYSMPHIFDPTDAKVKFGQVSSTGTCKVGTMTACLVSTPTRPCLDVCPIPPTTNEMGTYVDALDALLGLCDRTLFNVIMFDAGVCSLANAKPTIERALDYVFCHRDNQRESQRGRVGAWLAPAGSCNRRLDRPGWRRNRRPAAVVHPQHGRLARLGAPPAHCESGPGHPHRQDHMCSTVGKPLLHLMP